jgi:hypothetical protein
MEPNRKMPRWQFPLWLLLIVVLVAPPIIAGCVFLLREMSAPLWAIGLGAVQVAIWLTVLVMVVRRALATR